MKAQWGKVINGVMSWLKDIENDNVLVSIFTYDTAPTLGELYSTPSELSSKLMGSIEAKGSSDVAVAAGLDGFVEVMEAGKSGRKDMSGWLQYGFLMTLQDSAFPKESIEKLKNYSQTKGVEFFFNAVTQIRNTFDFNDVVKSLGGVHYSIGRKSDYGKIIPEAL